MRRLGLAIALIVLLGLFIVVASFIGALLFSEREYLERVYFLSQILMPVLVTVSAALVIWQIADVRMNVRVQQFGATGDRLNDLTRSLIASPDLYPFFYLGRRVPRVRQRLRHRVQLTAEFWLDVFDAELLRVELFPQALPDAPSLRDWMVESFRRSPALRDFLAANASLYRNELHELAREARRI